MAKDLQVEYLPLADLLPYARNSRTHSDEQVAQIAASIREFGFTNPVLISETNDIIAGHGRVMAARKLELAQVPCIRLSHLSETQRKAYVIADNQLATRSDWNVDMLALELKELEAGDFNLDILGFDKEELADLLLGNEPDAEDPEIPADVPWGDELGVANNYFVLICKDTEHFEKLALRLGVQRTANNISGSNNPNFVRYGVGRILQAEKVEELLK